MTFAKPFAVSLFVFAFSLSVAAADLTVTSNADLPDANPGDGVCATAGGGVCTFRAAVQETNSLSGADTIYFNFASPTSITLGLGEVLINDNVTISGSKMPADIWLIGNGTSRVLSVLRAGITVTIRGVTISNGVTTGNNPGGGIYVAAANISLENVVVRDNISGTSGGGVYSGTGVLRFINSTASGNIAQGNGGGGGISVQGNNSLIQRSNIINNQAPRGGGGVEVSGGTTTIVETTLDNNYTNGGGGGLLAVFGTANVSRSTISNNTAYRSGGGIALPYGNINLINSTVSGNTVTNGGGGGINTGENGSIGYLTVRSSTIVSNTSLYSGGVTGGYAAGVRIGNSILSGNVALTGPNINSQFTSLGGNLVSDRSGSMGYLETDLPDGTNPMLGPLANNGGPTKTHALLAGSPAINFGLNSGASDLATDQRGKGFLRLVGQNVDIGAFEFVGKMGSR